MTQEAMSLKFQPANIARCSSAPSHDSKNIRWVKNRVPNLRDQEGLLRPGRAQAQGKALKAL